MGNIVHGAAVVVALGIAVILFGLTFVKFRNPNAYLLVLHYDDDAEHDILSLLRRTVKQHRLRSKTVTRAGAEMTIEVRLGDKQDLVAAMLSIEGGRVRRLEKVPFATFSKKQIRPTSGRPNLQGIDFALQNQQPAPPAKPADTNAGQRGCGPSDATPAVDSLAGA